MPRLCEPISQFLYYIAPPVGRDQRYQHQETNRERRQREHRERQKSTSSSSVNATKE